MKTPTLESIELTEEQFKAIAKQGNLTWLDVINNYECQRAMHPHLAKWSKTKLGQEYLSRCYYA